MNVLSQEKILEIYTKLLFGKSIRVVAKELNLSTFTVGKYAQNIYRPDPVSDSALHLCKLKRKKLLKCGYCNLYFVDKNGEKTSDLKCGRIKRAFCTHRCAMNYRAVQRRNDKCKRCGLSRIDLMRFPHSDSHYQASGVCFSNGYCQSCYSLLKQYHGDEELCEAHEIRRVLKSAIKERKTYAKK